jgi:uncharacterized protein with ATP-grasp and redox domains
VSDTVVFSKLLNPDEYLPGLWDMVADESARSYWLPALKKNSRHMLDSFKSSASAGMREKCDDAHEEFCGFLDGFERDLDPKGPRTVNELVHRRQEIFTGYGIPDPYKDLKKTDNERALALLKECPDTIPRDVPEDDRLRWIVSLVMAGNLLDMGSAEARRLHKDAKVGVFERTAEVAGKKWFRDHLDQFESRLRKGPAGDGSIVICIDNAGAEIVLGVTTFAKHLASLGYSCTIASNEVPALNDMTAAETVPLLDTIAEIDFELKYLLNEGTLSVISSGSVTSGLNMLRVSGEFDRIASRAELLILFGQGRAVETNWNTRLSMPWARIATVKDPSVAEAVGCQVFDPVMTYAGLQQTG